MAWMTSRNVLANTHFEEWWFKTSLTTHTAKAAFNNETTRSVLMRTDFFMLKIHNRNE